MNGAPGTLLEQGIVGLLKCVKILVILQSRWRLVVRIPSILLFVNPERLLLFLAIALLQKVHGGKRRRKKKKNTTKMKHWWSLLQINSLNVSRSLCLLKFLTKIGKDALSEVYVCQAWHIAIHSSLMCQGPPTAKPLLLLHRLLITVDKHAGGDPPPLLHPHQLRLERYATSRKFWLGSFAQFLTPSKISKNDKVIKRKLQNNPHL